MSYVTVLRWTPAETTEVWHAEQAARASARREFAGLSAGHRNVLLRRRLYDWDEVTSRSDAELLALPEIGPVTLRAIRTEQANREIVSTAAWVGEG